RRHTRFSRDWSSDVCSSDLDAVTGCREFIQKQFGDRYLPEKPRVYGSKEGAQEAHEAIRPTDVSRRPTDISGLEKDAEKLYDLKIGRASCRESGESGVAGGC